MNRPAHKNKGVNRTKKRTVLPLCFHRQRARRGNRLRLFRRPIHGPRADDHVAECRPDVGQVPLDESLQLLRLEPDEVG